jgi:hypothetical protein
MSNLLRNDHDADAAVAAAFERLGALKGLADLGTRRVADLDMLADDLGVQALSPESGCDIGSGSVGEEQTLLCRPVLGSFLSAATAGLDPRRRARGLGRATRLALVTAVPIERRKGHDDRYERSEGSGHGNHLLRGGPPAAAPRSWLGRQVDEDRVPSALRELEDLRLAQGVSSGVDSRDLLGAARAGGEVPLELGAAALRQVVLDVIEEVDVFWMHSGHHLFDYSCSPLVPRISARRVLPRKMRDFTVPSATPVSSAISAYEHPRTS